MPLSVMNIRRRLKLGSGPKRNPRVPTARPDPDIIFKPVGAHRHLVLAVSGGSDSMALLRLAAKWGKSEFTVLTVDHGLRAAAGIEAKQVAKWSAAFGLAHVTLTWEGEKPSTGL